MNEKEISGLKSVLWFLVKLNIIAIPLYLITYFGYSLPQLQDVWAAALSQSLVSLGYHTSLSGHLIGVAIGNDIIGIDLSWDSTGWKSLYALTALVFASGICSLRGKLRFLAFGLPLIAFLNLLRIDTSTVILLNFGKESFNFFHGLLWEVMMVALVLAIWYLFFLREKDNKR